MARFQRFDLRQSMAGLGVFDVVLCRNVLIYFDVETKKKILGEIRKSLVSGAIWCWVGQRRPLTSTTNTSAPP